MSELSRTEASGRSRARSAEPPSPDSTTPDGARRWVPIVHGAITIVLGLLLLFTPGRTLVFFATLTGISLVLVGLAELVAALRHGLTGAERTARLAIALLAAVAGIVVIARPEGSLRTIVIVAGIYLLIMGVTTAVLGSPGSRRGRSLLLGVVALAAGVALLTWPDVTVGVAAAIYGVFLVALGAVEIVFGLKSRRS